jgi:rSAM/selenodomain-associated transferase 2/rSAM/selenodomain-associated transferase 1
VSRPPVGAGDAPPPLGVVIPTLDEEEALPRVLADLALLGVEREVVVSDGGSTDRTREVARSAGVRVVTAPRGRAAQMNAGAAALDAPWLLFLHADSRLPPPARGALADWLERPGPEEAAHFRFALDARGLRWRLVEGAQRARERLTGLAYGDQGLLVSRRRWEGMGGFRPLPLMEDVEAVRRLRRTGGVARLDAPLLTSARRYREEGFLRAPARNALLLALHLAGVPAERLARWYRPRQERGLRRILLVFAKAPRVGRVKTRLARDVGSEEAARIYREMGRAIVDRLRSGRYRLVVCHAPADGGAEVGDWLGREGLELRPQARGDLGDRMRFAFEEAFAEGDRVCIVGTDSPDLDRDRVVRAFERVEAEDGPDAVFGPALDGGYYLLALRRPAPALFREIPWSTSKVLARSLERAREAGLRHESLEPLRDVDRLEDLPAAFRADFVGPEG